MLKVNNLIEEDREKKEKYVVAFNNFFCNPQDKLLYDSLNLKSTLSTVIREKKRLYFKDWQYYCIYLKLDFCIKTLNSQLFEDCRGEVFKQIKVVSLFLPQVIIDKAYSNFDILISHFSVPEQAALMQCRDTDRMFNATQLDNVTKNNLVGEFWEKYFLTIIEPEDMLYLIKYNANKFLKILEADVLISDKKLGWVDNWEKREFTFPIIDSLVKLFRLSERDNRVLKALYAENNLICIRHMCLAAETEVISARKDIEKYMPFLYNVDKEDIEELWTNKTLIEAKIFSDLCNSNTMYNLTRSVALIQGENRVLDWPLDTTYENLVSEFFPFVLNDCSLTSENFSYIKESVESIKKALQQSSCKDILLWGPPGFGKTQLVRAITKELNIEIIETVEKKLTDNARFNLIATAKNIKGFVNNFCILIDEAEDILKDKNNKSVLIQELENKKVNTFWIVNDIVDIPEAFLRRFDYVLQISEMPLSARADFSKKLLGGEGSDSLSYKIAQSIHTPAEIKSAIDWCHATQDYSWPNISAKIMNYQKALSKSLKSELGDFTIDVISPDGTYSLEDFAGYNYVKEEAREILDVFTHPGKYSELGAKIPKGIILAGEAGVGKTMFARCLANHLSTTLVKADSSALAREPQRIKILFEKAKSHAPCILFIDEIDVLGSKVIDSRGIIDTEKQKILNQLLIEIDGFECFSGVMVIGATHRANILDEALTRSGRLGKTIYFRPPSFEDRKNIIEYYCKKIKTEDNINYVQLAKLSAAFTSADIAMSVNEAALAAARENKGKVSNQQLVDSINRVFFGTSLNGAPVTNSEKWKTSIHEAGHALVAIKNGRTPQRATIKPHIKFMGMVEIEEQEGVYSTSLSAFKKKVEIYIAGLVAEEIIFSEHSNGVSGDLEVINKLLSRYMETSGMSESLKQMTVLPFQAVSSNMLEKMEEEKIRIIEEAKEKTKKWLIEHRKQLIDFAKFLYEQRSLDKESMDKWFAENILGKEHNVQDTDDIELLIKSAYNNC